MRDWRRFLKKSCAWWKDRRSTKCKTVTCVSERKVSTSVHVAWVCSNYLAPLILLHKARRTSLWSSFNLDTMVCLQRWKNRQPSMLHHTSQCTSGDDAFNFRHRSQGRIEPVVTFCYRRRSALWQPAPSRCTRSSQCVFSYVTVSGWSRCLWKRNVFNLSSQTLRVCAIPFLLSFSRDVSTIPVHVSAR